MKYTKKDKQLIDKIISNIIKEHNINPNKYYGNEALTICNDIYRSLDNFLDDELKKYNWLDIHYILLEYYSDNIEELNNSKEHDEMLKHQIYVIGTFIEYNLDKSYKGNKPIESNQVGILASLFSFLYIIQEDRTILSKILKDFKNNKKAINYIHIEIDENFLIHSIINNNNNNNKYYYYHIDFDSLEKLSKEITPIITEELNIDFLGYMFILMLFVDKNISSSLKPFKEELFKTICKLRIKNTYGKKIIKIHYNDLIKELEIKPNDTRDKEKWLYSIFDHLIIDKSNIRENDNYINIDYRKKRPNRFDLKPIIKEGDYLIFSIESLYIVYYQWNYSFEYFYLPYNTSLERSMEFLEEKKKVYENKIVSDIKTILTKKGYKTFTNFYVHKILKKNTLSYLGDYDVIGINDIKKEILLIEAKFIKPSRDKVELLDQQLGMYGELDTISKELLLTEDKLQNYDEKFARRILYMQKNYKDIFSKNKLINNNDEYTIKSFMVFNRYFKPIFKNLDFDVISINELEKII